MLYSIKYVMNAIIFILFIVSTFQALGFDHELLHSVSNLVCLKQAGYNYAIFRGYRSYGIFDPVILDNLKNAETAAIKADVYLFPCVKCLNPRAQVDTLVDGIKNYKYGMIWIDIEIYAWNDNLVTNQQFILDMIDQVKKRGVSVGVYTSYHNWEYIVGINWEGIKEVPLWYAHWDRVMSFDDFKPFGGWTKPVMKQFASDGIICGTNIDQDFY